MVTIFQQKWSHINQHGGGSWLHVYMKWNRARNIQNQDTNGGEGHMFSRWTRDGAGMLLGRIFFGTRNINAWHHLFCRTKIFTMIHECCLLRQFVVVLRTTTTVAEIMVGGECSSIYKSKLGDSVFQYYTVQLKTTFRTRGATYLH